MSIQIRELHKTYGDYPALHPTDLTIENGEMAALLGPSGSGKTTLLRLIAGLESADGSINYVQGANVAGFVKVADAMLAQGIV